MKEVTRFQLSFEGGNRNETKLVFNHGRIEFYCPLCKLMHKSYEPSVFQWDQFFDQLDYLEIWNWGTQENTVLHSMKSKMFDDRELNWQFEMTVNGKFLKTVSANNSKALFNQDLSRSFLNAISKLTNGLFTY